MTCGDCLATKPLRSTAKGEVAVAPAEVLPDESDLRFSENVMLKHSIRLSHEKGLTAGEVICGYLLFASCQIYDPSRHVQAHFEQKRLLFPL